MASIQEGGCGSVHSSRQWCRYYTKLVGYSFSDNSYESALKGKHTMQLNWRSTTCKMVITRCVRHWHRKVLLPSDYDVLIINRIAWRTNDKRLLKLIRLFLNSWVMDAVVNQPANRKNLYRVVAGFSVTV